MNDLLLDHMVNRKSLEGEQEDCFGDPRGMGRLETCGRKQQSTGSILEDI